jgi:hypothetical protein
MGRRHRGVWGVGKEAMIGGKGRDNWLIWTRDEEDE